MDQCQQLHDFVAGELSERAADSFRDHLGSCDSCPAELGDLLQLVAIEEAVLKEDADDIENDDSGGTGEPTREPEDELATRRQRRRMMWIGGAGLVAAAAVALAFVRLGTDRRATDGAAPDRAADVFLATAEHRPIDYRVSYADDYRPREVMRSGTQIKEKISNKTLGVLEDRGQLHQLANAYLLMHRPEDAEATLAELDQSARVLADRGVAAALGADYPKALRLFAASLEKEPDDPRVLWNQAMVHRELNLPLGAAALFAKVAALGEPGWSEEAAELATSLRGDLIERNSEYRDVWTQVITPVVAGDVPPLIPMVKFPGIGRLLFYDAVRAGGDRESLESLRPHARQIDATYPGNFLETALDAALATDLTKRAALATTYRSLLTGISLTARERASFLASARASDSSDILFGGLLYTAVRYGELLDEYLALAGKTADPWHQILAIEQRAKAARAAGRNREAAALLESALVDCDRHSLPYRCATSASELMWIELDLYRLDRLRRIGTAAIRRIAANEPVKEDITFTLLAQAELFSDDIHSKNDALARAYVFEYLYRRPDECAVAIVAYRLLTRISMNKLELGRAHREDSKAEAARVACAESMGTGEAYLRGDLLFAAPNAAKLSEFREQVSELRERASGVDSLGLDVAEGRALLTADPPAGRQLLASAALSGDSIANPSVDARKYRAYAYLALAMDAARRGDYSSAVGHVAEELGIETPSRCLAALAWEESLMSVVVGEDGTIAGRFVKSHELDSDPLVASQLALLAGCTVVDVLARAPFFGRARLLPESIAWRFVAKRQTHATTPVPPRRVVVADIVAPPSLGLPKLRPWRGDAPDLLLRGRAATPQSVLRSIELATDIEIHAHGLLGANSTDAMIVLSGADGDNYQLNAENVAQSTLRGRPLVVLAACHAARTASNVHQPWGLPLAFLLAGADTVIASPNPIPDVTSTAFFDAVRDEMERGRPAPLAVRNVRLRWKQRSNASGEWAADVLVFE